MAELQISKIAERDVDLLILEELFVSAGFASWFLAEAAFPADAEIVKVAHSVASSTGESDIELTLKSDQSVLMLLIENKIAAPFQRDQARRYRQRAESYVQQGKCSQCHTMLIAPKSYVGDEADQLGFDKVIAYEAVLHWLESHGDADGRRQFKLTLLRNAITHGASGWTLVRNESVTEFWRRYWELAKALAPELGMERPGEKPAASSFIYFRPSELPKEVKLIHKVSHGCVDLQFARKAQDVQLLKTQYGRAIEPGMTIQRAGRSAVIRLHVPNISLAAPFADSEPAVREALWAARLLLLWFRGVQGKGAGSPMSQTGGMFE